MAAADPLSAQGKRDLSISYNKLGDASLELGDTTAAKQYFEKFLKLSEQLAAAEPLSARAKRDLSIS